MQSWVENDYDTRILSRNVSFSILKKLTKLGDEKAQKVYNKEIIDRFIYRNYSTRLFLIKEHYINDLTFQARKDLIEYFFESEDFEISKIDIEILNKLKDSGVSMAKWIFEEELTERFINGDLKYRRYLILTEYLKDLFSEHQSYLYNLSFDSIDKKQMIDLIGLLHDIQFQFEPVEFFIPLYQKIDSNFRRFSRCFYSQEIFATLPYYFKKYRMAKISNNSFRFFVDKVLKLRVGDILRITIEGFFREVEEISNLRETLFYILDSIEEFDAYKYIKILSYTLETIRRKKEILNSDRFNGFFLKLLKKFNEIKLIYCAFKLFKDILTKIIKTDLISKEKKNILGQLRILIRRLPEPRTRSDEEVLGILREIGFFNDNIECRDYSILEDYIRDLNCDQRAYLCDLLLESVEQENQKSYMVKTTNEKVLINLKTNIFNISDESLRNEYLNVINKIPING